MHTSFSKPALAILVSFLWLVPAHATNDLDGAKYALIEKGGKIVRMEKETGQMSICAIEGSNLICRMAADERDAYLGEIDSLEEKVATLEKQTTAQKPEEKSDARKTFDRELERTMDFAKDAMKRFFQVIEDLNKDYAEKDKI